MLQYYDRVEHSNSIHIVVFMPCQQSRRRFFIAPAVVHLEIDMHKLFRHPPLERLCLRALSTMLLCLGLTGLAVAKSSSEPFHFGEVDLEFLDQIKQLDKKFEDRGLIYREPELNAYVDRVGRSLINADEQMENVVWRFRVFRDPSVNAFALPNGSIYVHTGLLALMENEAQLAGVMAHE